MKHNEGLWKSQVDVNFEGVLGINKRLVYS